MLHNIYAFTEHSSQYPGYVSINRRNDKVAITVRSRGNNGTQLAELELPKEELLALAEAVKKDCDAIGA